MRFLLFIPAALLVLLGLFLDTGSARADEPRLISRHGEWLAYTFMEDGSKVCYMASQPKSSKGDYTSRGNVFALITHRPAESKKNVFSYVTGYPYKPESEVTVQVGNKTFTLFTQDEIAWTPDDATDTALTEAIRKGSNMVVKGTSARGTATTDTFSLKGSGAAYDVIGRECGV